MRRLVRVGLLLLLACIGTVQAQQKQDTIVVARDGTGEYRTIQEAVEAVRAFMDYTVTIYIKDGIYKEKLVIPSWVKNVQLVGVPRVLLLRMMIMPILIRWVLFALILLR
jgi:pectinesterase